MSVLNEMGTGREMGTIHFALVLGRRRVLFRGSHLENLTGEAGNDQLDDVRAGYRSGYPTGEVRSGAALGDAAAGTGVYLHGGDHRDRVCCRADLERVAWFGRVGLF